MVAGFIKRETPILVRARAAMSILPTVAGIAAALLIAVPVFARAAVLPSLPLVLVLVWSTYQPRHMPPWAALVVGVATDLAQATPIGVNAMLMPLVALAAPALDARLGPRAFAVDWLLALALICAYNALAWALLGAVDVWRDPALLIAPTLITWAMVPLAARAVAWAERGTGTG